MKESKNMFELICMSLLGVVYVHACKEEAAEEKRQKEEERIRDLKILFSAMRLDTILNIKM